MADLHVDIEGRLSHNRYILSLQFLTKSLL